MAAGGIRISITARASGAARLSRRKAREALSQALDELSRGAVLIEGRAKRRAPVDMGRLRTSITHTGLLPLGNTLAVRVGTNVEYARFVEFGTGPAGRRSQLTDTAREAMAALGYQHGAHGGWPPLEAIVAWVKRKGIDAGGNVGRGRAGKGQRRVPTEEEAESLAFLIQRRIRGGGTKAQPFLFPAFEESRDEIVERMGQRLKVALGP